MKRSLNRNQEFRIEPVKNKRPQLSHHDPSHLEQETGNKNEIDLALGISFRRCSADKTKHIQSSTLQLQQREPDKHILLDSF